MGLVRSKTELERALGYKFRDPKLLTLALTHRSYANENGLPDHNERLEFLGDAVLGAVAAEWLFRRYPEMPEGDLSKRKSHLVSAAVLAGLADELGVGRGLLVGVGEERSGGRGKPSLLADSAESVIGAIYLDGGLEPVRALVTRLLAQVVEERPRLHETDSKTRLQEELQARGWSLPEYRLVAEMGPDHEKRFVVECRVCDHAAGRGEGRSKKIAEQRAASEALESLSTP
jgi:ribonuclease III